MNKELTLCWCDELLGNFSLRKCLPAWDSYEAHMTDKVKRKLVNAKAESVIVPGGCTKYIQAPDLVWNKLFKARIHKFYDDWLASEKHQFTPAGNMKPVPRRLAWGDNSYKLGYGMCNFFRYCFG